MGKIEKIITALGILTPAEYNTKKVFLDEERDLFNSKAKTAIYDAVVAGSNKDLRLERTERTKQLENSFRVETKISAALSAPAYAKPAKMKLDTHNKTRNEIEKFC